MSNFIRGIFTRQEIRSFVFFEVFTGFVASFFSLFLFVFISNVVLTKETILTDVFLTDVIFSFRTAWLTKIMFLLSLMGSEVIIFGSILIVIFLTIRKHKKETFIFSFLLLFGVTATTFLKLFYKVPRPEFSPLILESSYSFPSGHALNSFLFYGALAYFFYHFTKNKNLSIIVALVFGIFVFLIGISRIYLGVHHPSDVVAGYIAGFWLLTTTILVDKTIIFFRLIRENSRSVQ